MSIAKFAIPAGVMVYVGLNYSHIAQNTLKTVKSSVGTVELTRIDKALREWSIMKSGEGGAYGRDHVYPKTSRFKAFIEESFDTPGRDPTLDQWSNPFKYKQFKDGYRLASLGPDGTEDTEDDLWLVRHRNKVTMNRSLESVGKAIDLRIGELKKAHDEALSKLGEMTGATDMINVAKAAAKIQQMDGLLKEYMLHHDDGLPSSIAKYLKGKLDEADKDPWGRPYRFARTEDGYRISSDGPDGSKGTDDDVFVERKGEELIRHHTFAEIEDKLAAAAQSAKDAAAAAFKAPDLPPEPDAEP